MGQTPSRPAWPTADLHRTHVLVDDESGGTNIGMEIKVWVLLCSFGAMWNHPDGLCPKRGGHEVELAFHRRNGLPSFVVQSICNLLSFSSCLPSPG